MIKRTHKELHAASAEMIEDLNSEVQSMQIKRIQGDFWLLFARELMDLLPRNMVDQTFLETHERIQEALKLSGNEMENFGAYGQDALTDWAREVREQITAVKGEI